MTSYFVLCLWLVLCLQAVGRITSCSCQREHAQSVFRRAGFVAKFRIISQQPASDGFTEYILRPNSTHVYQVRREEDRPLLLAATHLHSASSPTLCGLELPLAIGEIFVLSGYFAAGIGNGMLEPHVNSCGIMRVVEPGDSYIHRLFGELFPANSTCSVGDCEGAHCVSVDPNVCLWDSFGAQSECLGNSACIRDSTISSCHWNRAC